MVFERMPNHRCNLILWVKLVYPLCPFFKDPDKFDIEQRLIWRIYMKSSRLALTTFALSVSAALMLSEPVHAASAGYCQSVAQDYARRNSSGGAISGAIRGSIRGGITGRILGGSNGAEKGRKAGRTLGAINGASQRARSHDYLYQQAYANCMRY